MEIMAEVPTEEVGTGSSTEGNTSDQQQQCLSSESLAEWRSSEQLDNGTPSTPSPYWDSDYNDDGGPKPAELYGKYTWKIDKFPQINKRELRSNPFEIGGHKWYILIYPQGCDVCNHLSLFLCVANHDKLLPGWSHFAQFTIAVVNKDPKKSKYSDTLHRFWKKEHDWGWKKFMELSKVFDGFIDSDTLIIKAQVQVIRERADRPFRCLNFQYRRELVRVYLTNVEQVCKRFVEERRSKLGKLIEDKVRWSSFCAFWKSMDYSSRCHMSQEKTDSILKVVVKHFFIEKEVTSTLVMDSLYSGLKALEGPNKGETNNSKYLDSKDFIPIIRMENGVFLLDDDVLPLLERAAIELLPAKDEKVPQCRLKDGAVGDEFNKDSIERDERRLTELGRWTIEIFILAHIVSKIEVAYQEAVSLKKQEELIREEEASWLAEIEHRSRRGTADKEKKSKKKQGKQKRNNRKGKDKGRDEKPSLTVQVEMEQKSLTSKSEVVASNEAIGHEKFVAHGDASDVSDSVDYPLDRLPLDSEYREVSPINWDTDASEAHPQMEGSSGVRELSGIQNGTIGKSSIVYDSSSTSSFDSFPSMTQKSNTQHPKCKKSSRRGRSHRVKQIVDSTGLVARENCHSPEASQVAEQPKFVGRTSKGLEPHPIVKEKEIRFLQRNICSKDANAEASEDTSAALRHSSKEITSSSTQKLVVTVDVTRSPVIRKKLSPDSPKSHASPDRAVPVENGTLKASAQKSATPKATEKTSKDAVPLVSRPGSAPIIPSSRISVSILTMTPTSPALQRSGSVAGRLSPKSAAASQSYVPLSYRNAIMGGPVTGRYSPKPSSSVVNSALPQYGSDRMDMNQMKAALPFGLMNHDPLQKNRSFWLDSCQMNGSRNLHDEVASQSRSQDNIASALPEEFPHLDIINELLDDETSRSDSGYRSFGNGHSRPHFVSHLSGFPDNTILSSSAGPSTGLCRFETSYPVGTSPEWIPHCSSYPYGNRQFTGLIPIQWQVSAGPEMPFLNARSSENDNYFDRLSEHSISSTGFRVYRPSNGH